MAMLASGGATSAIEESPGDAPNCGKVFSSKSGLISDESRQRLVVAFAGTSWRRIHGASAGRVADDLSGEVLTVIGVAGVVSREVLDSRSLREVE